MSTSAPISEADSSERNRRLRNLSWAFSAGLYEEIKQKKEALWINLSQDFVREITVAETCVYKDDYHGAVYHGLMADVLHRTLNELEQLEQQSINE